MNKKDISIIPEGPYCYEHTGKMVTKDFVWDGDKKVKVSPYQFPEMKPCPYFSNKNGEAYCTLLESSEGLLFDQVKECGINNEY